MTLTAAEESTIHDTLVGYDNARKAEGYAVAYRRWVEYLSIFEGRQGKPFGRHIETMYLNKTNGKALLVKVQPDGGISAFECVA